MGERSFDQCRGSLCRRLRQDAQSLQIGEREMVGRYDLGGKSESSENDRFGLQKGAFLGLVRAFGKVVRIWT